MSVDSPDKQPKSGIEKLPESVRKKILIVSIVIIMLVTVGFWLWTFPASIKISETGSGDQKLQTIGQEVETIFEATKDAVSQFKDQIDTLSELATSTRPTSSIELSSDDIEKLKEKILDRKTTP